jgi:hypothetical protein
LYNIRPEQFTDRNLESLYGIMNAHGYCFSYGKWSVAILLTPPLRKRYGCWKKRISKATLSPVERMCNGIMRGRIPDIGRHVI